MATTSPATAVVDGTTGRRFVSQRRWAADPVPRASGSTCSGTLIAPNVVLTAAHCTAFFTGDVGDPDEFGPDDWRISFDADGRELDLLRCRPLRDPPGLAGQLPRAGRQLEAIVPQGGLEDIALVCLTEGVAGIDPAPVADADYWDEIDPAEETFTVVGYGTDEFITGSATSPRAITVYDGARSTGTPR